MFDIGVAPYVITSSGAQTDFINPFNLQKLA